MSENVLKFTPRQARCLSALLTGATIHQAAQLSGVTEKTVSRWKASDLFRVALQKGTDDLLRDSSLRLATMLPEALTTLDDLQANGSGEGVRRMAANNIAELALKFRGEVDVTDRLDKLENKVFKNVHK